MQMVSPLPSLLQLTMFHLRAKGKISNAKGRVGEEDGAKG